MIIKQNVPIYDICWLNHCKGGIISTLYEPQNKQELIDICRQLYREGKAFDVIGHTSNIYFLPDYSVENMVSTRKVKDISFDDNYIIADCGVSVRSLARKMVDEGIKGFEGLTDLPGTLAAAVYGNASCFGCSVNQLLIDFELLTLDGSIVTMKKSDLKLSRRSTVFKRGEKSGVILSVRLKKEYGDSVELRSLAAMNHAKRKQTQPGPKDNLGSIFSNSGKPRFRYKMGLFLLKPFSLINRILISDKEKLQTINRRFLFTLWGASFLEPYVYGWNRFIWKDEKAHLLFWHYVECHKKLFTGNDFEIEIKQNVNSK